jgi:heat shock protein HslJ
MSVADKLFLRKLKCLGPLVGLALTTMLTACAVNSANTATLENTYWRLLTLRGKPIELSADQREPHLILQTAQKRLVGSGGCNRLMGSFTVDGAHLSFGRTASTMMACPQGMEQERAFLDALSSAARWRIDGQRMQLRSESDETLAEFEARNMQ